MQIHYSLGESMEVLLERSDFELYETTGYTMARYGVVGNATKTWVRQDPNVQEPEASFDGDSDLHISMPSGSLADILPVTITRDAIQPGWGSGSETKVAHFFGDEGEIIVSVA